jgi:hypothetical protein
MHGLLLALFVDARPRIFIVTKFTYFLNFAGRLVPVRAHFRHTSEGSSLLVSIYLQTFCLRRNLQFFNKEIHANYEV